ncbi:LysE family translocator [Luteococcus sediminum]
MVSLAAVLGFGLAVTPVVLTPGASFTLVSGRGIAGDRRGAWATIAGTGAGILTHGILAGAGLALVVMRSAEVYRLVRLAGAIYLVCLGAVLLWRGLRGRATPANREQEPVEDRDGRRVWQAYVANVLNVKAASVYLTLAPQFITAGGVGVGSMLILAAAHVAVMTLWLGAWSLGLTAVTARFNPQRWMRRVDVAGGAALVFLGLRTARPTP